MVRRAREHGPAGGPVRESLSAWRLLLNDLRAAWRALLSRLRVRAAALAAALPGAVGVGAAHANDARDAREAYRALLVLGCAHAVPRRAHQTPDEYLGAWRAALPAAGEAAELTVTYTRARYARPAATGVSAARLRALLRRIQGVLSGTRSGA